MRMSRNNAMSLEAVSMFWKRIAIVAGTETDQRSLLDHIDRIHPGLRAEILRVAADAFLVLLLQKFHHGLHATLEGF